MVNESRIQRVRTRVRAFVLVVALVVGGGFVHTAGPAPAAAAPARTPVQPDESSAAATARACGRDVEILAGRSEYTQAFVSPDGTATFKSTVLPARVRRAGESFGLGAGAGLGLQVSNASDKNGLAGPFWYGSASALPAPGVGPGGSVASDGKTTAGTVGVGASSPFNPHGGKSNTYVSGYFFTWCSIPGQCEAKMWKVP